MAELPKFIGAIGRALQRFAKKTPDAFQVPAKADHLSLRYAAPDHPIEITQDANNAYVSDPRLRWFNTEQGREHSTTRPSINWAYEKWPLTPGVDDPFDQRTIAALTSTKAKSLGDPLLVPRLYNTAWDVLEQAGAYDRNPFGGLTESNLTRKAPYLQSYLLKRGMKAPHVELHPNYLKAEDVTPTVGRNSPWKIDQLGHDEGRYGALQQLREYMESHAHPMERKIQLDRDYQTPERQLERFSRGEPEKLEDHTAWLGSYARGWDKLPLDQQIGALGLSEAGMLSKLLESQGHVNKLDRSLWSDEAPWANTLRYNLGRGALSDLASRGIGDRVQKRALMTDWLYRQAQRGRDPEDLVKDADTDFGRGIFYAQGGLARMSGGGVAKTKRLAAALKRWLNVPHRAEYRPTELYMPLSKGDHIGPWAYRDPRDAELALEGLDEAAIAPLLLRRQPPGGSGLLNRYTDEGDRVLITDPSATRLGFKQGGLAQCSCGGHK